MTSSRVLDVAAFVSERASEYAKLSGESPRTATKKLRYFIRAILDTMDLYEEEEFPLPTINGKRETLTIKKVGGEEFSIDLRTS